MRHVTPLARVAGIVLAALARTTPLSVSADTMTHAPDSPLTIVLAGDSTVCDYNADETDQRGWGQLLPEFLRMDRVQLHNLARGGRSSKSFQTEGRWHEAMSLKPDLVLIQFGHNDNPGKGPDRETLPGPVPDHLPDEGPGYVGIDWYRLNLKRFIDDCRQIGAVPVLVTPMERRFYEADTQTPVLTTTNKPWADAALAVAQAEGVACIDLNGFSRATYERLGPEGTAAFQFTQDDGQLDNTHHSIAGARLFAEQVAIGLAEQVPLAGPVLKPLPAASE